MKIKQGFTIFELIISLTILSVLGMIVINSNIKLFDYSRVVKYRAIQVEKMVFQYKGDALEYGLMFRLVLNNNQFDIYRENQRTGAWDYVKEIEVDDVIIGTDLEDDIFIFDKRGKLYEGDGKPSEVTIVNIIKKITLKKGSEELSVVVNPS